MSVQAKHAEIEWRRMADHETYYALRDGPRIQRGQTAVETLSRYIAPDQVALANRIAATHGLVHAGYGRGNGEAMERVQGGDSNASREIRLTRMSTMIRLLAGYSMAALRVGTDGYGCYRGICLGDTQAEMMRRVRYPVGSKATFRRLFQETMEALSEHAKDHPLDLESNLGAYSR